MSRIREALASLLGLAAVGGICVAIDDRARDVVLRWITKLSAVTRAPRMLGEWVLDTANTLDAGGTLFLVVAVVGVGLMLLLLRS